MSDTYAQALPPGYRFNEFEIEQVIGEGGFGIVYSAWDHQLERRVAIKEFMPASMALRGDNMHLLLRSERFVPVFQAGMHSFIQEARILARFSHPGLLHVLRFWQDNDTAYMVTEFYSGDTLKNCYQRAPQQVNEAWIRALLPPLLSALRTLHDNGYLHRDIALDNIQIQDNMLPVLLDFGSACREIGHLTDKTEVMLKPGYAPVEQYSEGRDGDQGPWTDIYALGAVLHMLVVGEPPPVSVVRLISNDYQPLAQRQPPGYSLALLRLIDEMLALQPEDRPQSIRALAERLQALDREAAAGAAGAATTMLPDAATPAEAPASTLPALHSAPLSAPPSRGKSRRLLLPTAGLAAGLVAVVIWLAARPAAPEPAAAASSAPGTQAARAGAAGSAPHAATPDASAPAVAANTPHAAAPDKSASPVAATAGNTPRAAESDVSDSPAAAMAGNAPQVAAPDKSASPAAAPASAAPPLERARVYLSLAGDEQVFIDGQPQQAEEDAGAHLLRLAPGTYRLAVTRGAKRWEQQLTIAQPGTWLVKVPENLSP